MKKLCLFFLFSIVIISFSNAQDFKPKYILAGNLFYAQETSGIKNSPTDNHLYDRAFGINPSFGFILGKGFALGIGLDIQRSSSNDYSYTTQNSTIYIHEKISKGSIFGPLVYLKYVHSLSNNISIGLKLKSTFLVKNSKTGKEPYCSLNSDGSITYYDYSHDYNNHTVLIKEEPIYLFQTVLAPEVQYKITPFIGLQASFNGLFYSVNRYKQGETKVFNRGFSIELNPSNWQFGVFFLLGDKQNTGTI